MKRILASVFVLSVLSVGIVGCGEKSKVEKKTTVTTPGGSETTKQTTETTKTGDKK
jgi:hypothetical protein